MSLAAILGLSLLLPGPRQGVTMSVRAMILQATQPQESSPNDSSQQGSPAQAPADQQKVPDQSGTPPAAASAPCQPNAQPGSGLKPDCKAAESTATKIKKHHRRHKPVASAGTPAEAGPTKTVIRNGGTADPALDLSPGLSPQQASHQLESTNQLLADSDANLKQISGRQLSAGQQDTVKQIKSYMEQAKGAANDGDMQRAYNLARKANLLSAELAGH
jgi:hypothetical protein